MGCSNASHSSQNAVLPYLRSGFFFLPQFTQRSKFRIVYQSSFFFMSKWGECFYKTVCKLFAFLICEFFWFARRPNRLACDGFGSAFHGSLVLAHHCFSLSLMEQRSTIPVPHNRQHLPQISPPCGSSARKQPCESA